LEVRSVLATKRTFAIEAPSFEGLHTSANAPSSVVSRSI
jgi:hypothetical protein